MGIVQSVADYFRSAPKTEHADQYGVLTPLMAASDYLAATLDALKVLQNPAMQTLLQGRTKPSNDHVAKGVEAYREFWRKLDSSLQRMEQHTPLSGVIASVISASGNLQSIEDNFQGLFGTVGPDKPEHALRSTSLVVVGFVEKADNYATWLGSLIEHLTADAHTLIPPFRTKELMTKAAVAANFASLNAGKWNSKSDGFLSEVKDMAKRGSDVSLQTESGDWIDGYTHDNQFSPMQQELISASLRNPILAMITRGQVQAQKKIDLMTSRKDWLTAKVVLEQAKLRGMDPESSEAKRLEKACSYYANLISHLEQKIERKRG